MAVNVIGVGTLGAIDEFVFASAVDALFFVLDFIILFGPRVTVLLGFGGIVVVGLSGFLVILLFSAARPLLGRGAGGTQPVALWHHPESRP